MMKKIAVIHQPEAARHQDRPLEWLGYFAGTDAELTAELANEGANIQGPNNINYIPRLDDGRLEDPFVTGEAEGRHWRSLFNRSAIHIDICLGSWNNGLFPYLPDWYLEANPGLWMKDQHGEPIPASMFDQPKPWLNFEYGPYLEELDRFMRGFIKAFGDHERLVYWVAGGEMLYPTYVYPERHSDYSEASVRHYRAWLLYKYGSAARLAEAWKMPECDAEEVLTAGITVLTKMLPAWQARNMPALDWHDFRLQALAEYFQKQYITLLESGSTRPLLAILHGDLFHDRTYAELGQSIYRMSRASDGLATSQILFDAVKPGFNRLYLQFAASTGKLTTSQALACVSPPADGQTINNSFTPWDVRKSVYECLGMGNWHVGLVQWKGDLPDGNWQIAGTPAQFEVRRIAQELEALSPNLTGMAPIAPRIGIWCSEAVWLLEGWLPEWTLLHQAAVESHVPYLSLFDAGLEEQIKRNPSLQAIVVPFAVYIRPEVDAFLKRYVEDGGTLVVIDDAAELRMGSGQSQLGWGMPFTSAVEEEKVLQPINDRTMTADVGVGAGRIIHIRSRYNRQFLDRIFYAHEAQIRQMWHWAMNVLEQSGLHPRPIAGLPETVASYVLSDGSDLLHVCINHSTEPVRFAAALQETWAGSDQWETTDLSHGTTVPGSLIHLEMDGRSTLVCKLRRRPANADLAVSTDTPGDSDWDIVNIDNPRNIMFYLLSQSESEAVVRILYVDEKSSEAPDSNKGAPIKGINMIAEVAPLFDHEIAGESLGNGAYRFVLDRSRMPFVYAPLEGIYKPYEGTIKLIVSILKPDGGRFASRTFVF